MNISDTNASTKVNAGIRIYEQGMLVNTIGVTDLSGGLPSGYNRYAVVWEPTLPDVTVELFVENGDKATVIVSGIMLNIG
ncbi:hypothetical protein NSX60_25185, partial [Salmonella enterica]|nr:hypothetical protein [Salmonella enterica]